jgi:hypothetical protein
MELAGALGVADLPDDVRAKWHPSIESTQRQEVIMIDSGA